jgi:hypothetical protein
MVSSTITIEGMILWREHKRASSFLADQAMISQRMPIVPTPIWEGAPRIRESRLKDFIIVLLILVIIKFLFF